ncbi:MAG: hypothetical protein ACRBC3_03930 [Burkholderiaceae bacterium]
MTRKISILAVAVVLGACAAPTSTSTPSATASKLPAYTGKVFVTEDKMPAGVQYEVIAKVEAKAKSGYSAGSNLYPLLADEARKLGANAVVGVTGGRKVTLLSWAAAFVEGTAVRVDNPADLKGLKGNSH